MIATHGIGISISTSMSMSMSMSISISAPPEPCVLSGRSSLLIHTQFPNSDSQLKGSTRGQKIGTRIPPPQIPFPLLLGFFAGIIFILLVTVVVITVVIIMIIIMITIIIINPPPRFPFLCY